MKEKLEKQNKNLHIIEKWTVIGIILFVLVQLFALGIIYMFVPENQRLTEEQKTEYNKDYLGHWYNGTFFINMTVKENFEDMETYDKMIEELNNNLVSKVCSYSGMVLSCCTVFLIVMAAYKEHKKKLLAGNTPTMILFAGLFLLLYKLVENIDLFIDVSYYSKYSKGFLSTASFYPQFHYIFILPVLLILLGLLLRHKQRKDLRKSNKNTEKIIKIICISILVVGLSFILYRFGIRVYELIMTLMNKDVNIRLPFYFYMLELPKSFATSSSSYLRIVVLRFVKDLPVFISSIITIILFVRIVLSYIKGNIDTDENKNRYKMIFVSLLVASLVFNLLGLLEVNIYNNEFLNQYKEATYTIALRSLTEPLFYGLFIYAFKHYVEIANYLNKSKK